MNLIIDAMLANDTNTSVTLKIRRSLSVEEKEDNIRTLMKNYVDPIYRKERVIFHTVDLTYIEKHDVTVGDDINEYDDIEFNMVVFESVRVKDFINEGITPKLKINPKTKLPLLHNGDVIFHATMLIPSYTAPADILLTIDK